MHMLFVMPFSLSTRYPFYGFQFHPEKPLFEHNPFAQIPHNIYARIVSMYFSTFFASEAAKSSRAPSDPQTEWSQLFDRLTPYSTSSPTKSYVFEAVYFFPPAARAREVELAAEKPVA